MSPARDVRSVPLVVDVDGSLVSGDLLVEGMARMIARDPLKLLALPGWLARGRASFKHRVARAAELPPETLALNAAVQGEIADAKAQRREVWLASAGDATVVGPLAEAVGAAGFFASDGRINLAGEAKAATLVGRFGEAGFDYVGNERRDLPVWRRARRCAGVGLGARLARELRAIDPRARLLAGGGGGMRDVVGALRPHHWVKNVLVFAAIVAAHETSIVSYLVTAALFVAFSVLASGTYLLNDVLDLPYDRGHPTKRKRALASGRLPLVPMCGLAALLVLSGLAGAFALSVEAGLLVSLYLAGSLAYSLRLKRWLFADVVVLALLYVLRLIAGAAAVFVVPSGWLLGFSFFLFLGLAIVKRQAALAVNGSLEPPSAPSGRAYRPADLPAMTALGAASGFAAVLVLALYIATPEVSGRYQDPYLLFPLCPLLLYWFGRLTLVAHRGAVGDDPVVFALRDRVSHLVFAAGLVLFLLAL